MTTVTTEVQGKQVVMTFLDQDRWTVTVDGKKLGSRFVNPCDCIVAVSRYLRTQGSMEKRDDR